ncbi:MAG TPA: transketolase family protein, partial [Candidatus Faecalicoccus intestinipullorum]|nr:transketolase family protein [Candidatus Faecalicoccus intestinipullorum]
AKEMEGIEPTIVNISSIKPIDEELIKKLAKEHEVIVTAEEHSVIGGLGSAVAEVLAKEGSGCRLKMIGLNDEFGQSGKPKDLLAYYGLDASSIAKKIQELDL